MWGKKIIMYSRSINETHHSCEKREYAFMILREYTIISHVGGAKTLFWSLHFGVTINLIPTFW